VKIAAYNQIARLKGKERLNWLDTLTRYEAVAVWLEGIALVAIFIWDRIDFYKSHKEIVGQLKLAQDQITATQNAERAWVLTELDWPKTDSLRVVLGSSTQRGSPKEEHTTVTVMLLCRNEGRSPAFVDKIHAYGDIVDSVRDVATPDGRPSERVHPIGPLAPGKTAMRSIRITCPGHLREDQLFSILVVVEYRDIFNNQRLTTCGYGVHDLNLYQQDTMPERNKFT
jgi:hypothetical protein